MSAILASCDNCSKRPVSTFNQSNIGFSHYGIRRDRGGELFKKLCAVTVFNN
jgi:hypothetical protein